MPSNDDVVHRVRAALAEGRAVVVLSEDAGRWGAFVADLRAEGPVALFIGDRSQLDVAEIMGAEQFPGLPLEVIVADP